MPIKEETRLPRRKVKLPASVLGLGLVCVCLLSCWVGIVAGRPFVIARRMRAENAQIERRIADMRMETQNLRKEVAALKTDAGMEREARRLGYMKYGEIPLLIPQ